MTRDEWVEICRAAVHEADEGNSKRLDNLGKILFEMNEALALKLFHEFNLPPKPAAVSDAEPV